MASLSNLKNLSGDPETPKKRKSAQLNKNLQTQYGKYSGIVDEEGKEISQPTERQAMKNMVEYLKKNTPESNIYRPEHIHTSLNYNKKKGSTST